MIPAIGKTYFVNNTTDETIPEIERFRGNAVFTGEVVDEQYTFTNENNETFYFFKEEIIREIRK